MRDCIEEGVLQSYVDDELSLETAEKVAAHLAACRLCAEAFNEAVNESAMFTKAFEAEMALEVPTVRLRERLETAIADLNSPAEISERKHGWSIQGWLTSLAGLFKASPQRALGFASLIAVVAFAAIFATIQLRRAGNQDTQPVVASNGGPKEKTTDSKVNPVPTPEATNPGGGPGKDTTPADKPRQKKQVKPNIVPEPDQLPKDELARALPGEQDYLKAIDSLSVEIQSSDTTDMKPSLRAEYERNLAIVNQAIDSTRRVARRHPKDPDAAAFLYSSYQSKLDLLSAVAEQVRPTIATR